MDSGRRSSGKGGDGLFRKLLWLTIFRLAIVTVLLGATAFANWRSGGELDPAATWLYLLVLATYLASLGFAVVLRFRRGLPLLAYAQILLDVGIAAAVVALTGYSESIFVFLFSLGVVNGSILLYRSGAIASALMAVGTYLALVLSRGHAAPSFFTLFVHASAFVITAGLAGYLAEQLRRTGEQLEERESDLAAITALQEAIVQSVEAGLLTIDGHGRVSFLNRAGELMTGLALADLRGQPAARWFSSFQTSARREETEFVNARGEKLRLGYDIFPLRAPQGDAVGDAIGQVVIFQDLTRLRAMEAAMQRSARLADLGRLAAGLAHELRNPLASMTGSIELLGGNLSLGAEDQRLMEIVVREAARLNQLVTRFLEFTRPVPLQREPVDLSSILQETLDVFANSPSAARVRLDRALQPAVVPADADQLRQVFWNLLVNAAQAIAARGAEGGRIEVSCGPGPDGGASIKVADDGVGIAAADLAKIFTPFFTTKEQGTGLGLAIVERIVDAHGGVVSVDSTPGQGTTFAIVLPPAEPGAAARYARAG